MTTSTNNKNRIGSINQAPISWKERDLLTASEKFMTGVLDFPLVEYALPCFPKVDPIVHQKIAQVWACTTATYHLNILAEGKPDDSSNMHHLKAARIYEQEAQRVLGSIFPMEHQFWKAFYTRQELEVTKPLVSIDAIHFNTNCQAQIAYQLLLQSIKAILMGHYKNPTDKKNHFENAKRLLMDLPMVSLISWINKSIANNPTKFIDIDIK